MIVDQNKAKISLKNKTPTSQPPNQSKAIFIIMIKIPRVKNIIGPNMNFKIGLKIKFITDKTKAVKIKTFQLPEN